MNLPSTTKSCGTLTDRHAESSVPTRHHASEQWVSLGGGGGGGARGASRPLPIQPLLGRVLAPVSRPIQHEGCCGGPDPQSVELQNWYVSHVESAQHSAAQRSSVMALFSTRPGVFWPSSDDVNAKAGHGAIGAATSRANFQ